PWPAPVSVALCKEVAMKLLADDPVGPVVPANIAASARKIAALLSVSERASIQKTGADSHFAEALAARIALDAATAEGNRLGSARVTPTVDADALAALTKSADEAAGRLQKEANAAIGKGEVESLQMITATSAALSRDMLGFKETADRLRGIAAAPRLGAGALDPEIVLPGQAPRPKAAVSSAPAPVRAELRDFQALDAKPGRWKTVLAVVGMLAFVGAAIDAFYLSVPHHKDIEAEGMVGVVRIDVSGASALVTVTPEFIAQATVQVPRLTSALRERKVKKAILMLPNGSAAGVLDVYSGKASGLPKKQAGPPK
ncbi:MAG: hypothetical protein ACXWLM_11125, partial [Myxococcales bacterium]